MDNLVFHFLLDQNEGKMKLECFAPTRSGSLEHSLKRFHSLCYIILCCCHLTEFLVTPKSSGSFLTNTQQVIVVLGLYWKPASVLKTIECFVVHRKLMYLCNNKCIWVCTNIIGGSGLIL